MRRHLLILLTALSLLLCVAVCGVWARSHREPCAMGQYDFTDHPARVEASLGRLYFFNDVTGPARYDYPTIGPAGDFAGFGFGSTAQGSWVYAPFRFVLLLSAATFAASLRLARRQKPAGLCRRCGYDLRATPDRCPECGTMPAARR